MKKTLSLLLACVLLASVLGLPVLGEEALPIDLDLTDLSGTVVYAYINQMVNAPENYIGKIIRLNGWYDAFVDSSTGLYYTSCFIPDASACCAQGIEFVWAGAHPFPEAYPEPGTGVTVTGRFEVYLEDDWMYIHLVDADVVWAEEAQAL